ncbi:uncharacterized protein LOC116841577 [Odontomachus brunneus]|uniref:uncharacterized protein LOC116841577 n=1 Tax=Odontomachus brunneus TaxID=486640 RepID=UPI0013F24EF5|nr:uncharacterized protein LOC116841577 [Odontomachus brunneus]
MLGGCRAGGSDLSESARRNEHSTLRGCCAGGSGSGLAKSARRDEASDQPIIRDCCAGGSGSGRAGFARRNESRTWLPCSAVRMLYERMKKEEEEGDSQGFRYSMKEREGKHRGSSGTRESE